MKRMPLRGRLVWLALAIAAAVFAVGCYNNNTGRTEVGPGVNFKLPAFPETGSNSVQVFTEMHYQPSYRVQEVPRILPPEGSVPVTGREITYTSLEEYAELSVPSDMKAGYSHESAVKLYQINCQVCHGPSLQGDGPVAKFITRGPLPANLTLELTQDSTDGEIFAFITGGGRQGLAAILRGRTSASPMPEFGKLLTEEERWTLVQYLRATP